MQGGSADPGKNNLVHFGFQNNALDRQELSSFLSVTSSAT